MFDPKRTADTYGLISDFVNRPSWCSSHLISLDARNRDPGGTSTSSLLIPRMQQIRSIELRDGFVSLPAGYTDPYVLMFLMADGLELGNIVSAGPVVQRHPDPTMIVPNHDAASGAFAHKRHHRPASSSRRTRTAGSSCGSWPRRCPRSASSTSG